MLIKLLLGLFTGSGGITSSLKEAYTAKLKAETQEQVLLAERDIAILEGEQDARREVAQIRRETAGHWEMRVAVGLIAIATATHYAAVVADSLFLFKWNVAKLPAPMDKWEAAIILSFFGLQGVVGVGSAVIRRMGK